MFNILASGHRGRARFGVDFSVTIDKVFYLGQSSTPIFIYGCIEIGVETGLAPVHQGVTVESFEFVVAQFSW